MTKATNSHEERYPPQHVGPLSHFVLPYAEEVPAAAGGHIARWDPARVLAEVAAKREILRQLEFAAREYAELDAVVGPTMMQRLDLVAAAGKLYWLEFAARALARPFAGRPGWRPEWAMEVTA